MSAFLSALSFYVVWASALWLVLVGVFAVLRPDKARKALGLMGSTARIHFTEHILRCLVGVAFIIASPDLLFPKHFMWFGVFLCVSSVVIMAAPRHWHHNYAVFWADRISSKIMRLMGTASILIGAWLVWVLLIAG
jgi:uncharacterized protein YjeT (DUF2065 family)